MGVKCVWISNLTLRLGNSSTWRRVSKRERKKNGDKRNRVHLKCHVSRNNPMKNSKPQSNRKTNHHLKTKPCSAAAAPAAEPPSLPFPTSFPLLPLIPISHSSPPESFHPRPSISDGAPPLLLRAEWPPPSPPEPPPSPSRMPTSSSTPSRPFSSTAMVSFQCVPLGLCFFLFLFVCSVHRFPFCFFFFKKNLFPFFTFLIFLMIFSVFGFSWVLIIA